MKIRFLNKFFPLLLLAFLSAFSGTASSFSTTTLDLNSRDYDYLQEDQNRQGHLFQKISANISFPEIVKYHSGSAGVFDYSPGGFRLLSYINTNALGHLLDKRSALRNQIFPFHFFW